MPPSRLEANDVLEHNLAKIASEVAYDITGDGKMRDEMVTCRLPGSSQIAPDHEVSRARDAAKTVYQQSWRVKGHYVKDDDGDGDGGAPRRRRNRRGRGADGQNGQQADGKGKGGGRGGAQPQS